MTLVQLTAVLGFGFMAMILAITMAYGFYKFSDLSE